MQVELLEGSAALDRLVAAKVMQWTREEMLAFQRTRHDLLVCPPYSTDIAAAWLVVEHVKENIWFYRTRGKWRCDIDVARVITAYADTAPLAICLAALQAVGYGLPNSVDSSE